MRRTAPAAGTPEPPGILHEPAFYSYTAPAPEGLGDAKIRPDRAFYSTQMSEFILRYDDMRTAASPAALLLAFCQSTYEAGATLANWDRAALERGE